MHEESCKGSKATKEYGHFPNVEGDMKMIDVFTGLLLVALIGGGFLLARHLFDRRNMMNPPMEMPWQSEYGPRDDYGRNVPPNQGYDGSGYGRPMYGPGLGILATADLPMVLVTILPHMEGQCTALAIHNKRV